MTTALDKEMDTYAKSVIVAPEYSREQGVSALGQKYGILVTKVGSSLSLFLSLSLSLSLSSSLSPLASYRVQGVWYKIRVFTQLEYPVGGFWRGELF